MTNGDIGMYWVTLRVFSKKLGTLLEELEQESAWTTVTEPTWVESDNFQPYEEVTEVWAMGLQSTTNTLAALLKVPVGFDTLLERRIRRTTLNDSSDKPKRLALARNLLALSQELLGEFDAVSRGAASAPIAADTTEVLDRARRIIDDATPTEA